LDLHGVDMEDKRKIYYYVDQWGGLREFHQNPCGCHPFDVVISSRMGRKEYSFSYSFKNQQSINAYVRTRKLTRLK